MFSCNNLGSYLAQRMLVNSMYFKIEYEVTKEDILKYLEWDIRTSGTNKEVYEEAYNMIRQSDDPKEWYQILGKTYFSNWYDSVEESAEVVRKLITVNKFYKIIFDAVSKILGKQIVDLDEGSSEFITEEDKKYIRFYDKDGKVYTFWVIWEPHDLWKGEFILAYEEGYEGGI